MPLSHMKISWFMAYMLKKHVYMTLVQLVLYMITKATFSHLPIPNGA